MLGYIVPGISSSVSQFDNPVFGSVLDFYHFGSFKVKRPACSFWVLVVLKLSWFLLILSLVCMKPYINYKKICSVYFLFISVILCFVVNTWNLEHIYSIPLFITIHYLPWANLIDDIIQWGIFGQREKCLDYFCTDSRQEVNLFRYLMVGLF